MTYTRPYVSDDVWKQQYTEYMTSMKWDARRWKAQKRVGYQCEKVCDDGLRCPERHGLHVHHLSYEHFGDELDEELQVLCPDHHAVVELRKMKCPRCCRPLLYEGLTIAAAVDWWRRIEKLFPALKWLERIALVKAHRGRLCPRCNPVQHAPK